MADLFDPSSSSSPSPPPPPPPPHAALNFSPDSDDISSLLHTLLHHSSQSSSSSAPPPPPPHDLIHHRLGLFAGSQQSGLLDSSSGINFRFAGGFYGSGPGERQENAFSGSIGISGEGIADDVECESEDQEDAPANRPPARSSSKRSRAAEVHNLTEKRRRQKINEKMKALQKLIPNSNKTDKASMLDEAIEYLKQLQLQVQMLTLRNGSSLHPFYLPSVSQAVQLPQMGSVVDDGNNSSRGIGFPSNHEASGQTAFDLSSTGASEYKALLAMTSENSKSGPLFVSDPLTNTHYRPFNPPMQSKGLCKGTGLPQLQLDMSQGQSSSSGVSS